MHLRHPGFAVACSRGTLRSRPYGTGFAALPPRLCKSRTRQPAHPASLPIIPLAARVLIVVRDAPRRGWFWLISAPRILWGAEMAGLCWAVAASTRRFSVESPPPPSLEERGKKERRVSRVRHRSRWSLRRPGRSSHFPPGDLTIPTDTSRHVKTAPRLFEPADRHMTCSVLHVTQRRTQRGFRWGRSSRAGPRSTSLRQSSAHHRHTPAVSIG